MIRELGARWGFLSSRVCHLSEGGLGLIGSPVCWCNSWPPSLGSAVSDPPISDITIMGVNSLSLVHACCLVGCVLSLLIQYVAGKDNFWSCLLELTIFKFCASVLHPPCVKLPFCFVFVKCCEQDLWFSFYCTPGIL